MTNIGNRLRKAREKPPKINQTEAASIAGVSMKTWSEWEQDRYEPSLSALEKFAEARGISLMELIVGDAPSSTPIPVTIAGLPKVAAGQKIKLLLTIELLNSE